MSKADELKAKNENLFERNTILLNENERLKKENAELKNTICTHEYYQNGYKQGKLEESRKREVEIFEIQGEVELRDVRIYDLNKKMKDLEKENKILRTHQTNAVLEELEMEVLKNSHRDRANNLQNQLTKAKELLKKWLQANICDSVVLFSDTEQFLKEVEK